MSVHNAMKPCMQVCPGGQELLVALLLDLELTLTMFTT